MKICIGGWIGIPFKTRRSKGQAHFDPTYWFSITNLDQQPITAAVKKNNANAPTVKFECTDGGRSVWPGESSVDGWQSPSIGVGETLYIRGVDNARWAYGTIHQETVTITGFNRIEATGKYAVGGNILSLLSTEEYHRGTGGAFAFSNLFNEYGVNHNLVDASNLVININTSSDTDKKIGMMHGMFAYCEALAAAPVFDITLNGSGQDNVCYKMFINCKNVESFAGSHIRGGLYGHHALEEMFSGCEKLVVPPQFSVHKNIGKTGLCKTFKGCVSLTKAPAIKMNNVGCNGMFYGCTSLNDVSGIDTSEVTNIVVDGLYEAFYGCEALTDGIDLSNVTIVNMNGLSGMYGGCKNLASHSRFPKLTSYRQSGVNMASCISYVYGNCVKITEHEFGSLPSGMPVYAPFTNNAACRVFTIHDVTPPSIVAKMLEGLPIDCAIRVPAASVDEYRTAAVWNTRAKYIRGIDTPEYNEIWYTNTNGEAVGPNRVDRFADENGNALTLEGNVYTEKGVLTLSGSLGKITGSAFYNRQSLKSIHLPDSVSELGNSVFENCPELETADLGAGIVSLGYSVFKNCTKLKEIRVGKLNPPAIYASALNGVPSDCVIRVPSSAIDAYKAAEVWSDRAEYIESL